MIDLACALCCAAEAREETSGNRSIVAILCHETRVFAGLADGIVGVMPLTSREIYPREYKGMEIPVVDTLRLLGHGALPRTVSPR